MGKKASRNTEKRAQIVTLSNLNFSIRQIAKKVKVSKTSVHTMESWNIKMRAL